MSTQRYSVSPHPIETLLIWVKSGEIAIPESQRTFVYGGITSLAELKVNLSAHCLPLALLDGEVPDYDAFLAERRTLIAKKIRDWFEVL